MINRKPATQHEALARIRAMLNDQKPADALEFFRTIEAPGPELSNAYGVCLMRCGHFDKALEVYRQLWLERGFFMKSDIPTVFVANYAMALLLNGDFAAAVDALRNAKEVKHPAVLKVRKILNERKKALTWFQRLTFALTGEMPTRAAALEFPPGETDNESLK